MPEPIALQRFYTGTEILLTPLCELATASHLPKRLMVIHGVGGVGKSSLLEMLRAQLQAWGVPVGFASGDEANSEASILTAWVSDLGEAGIRFPNFGKALRRFRVLLAKVEQQSQASQDARSKALGNLGRAVVDTAISTIPGMKPILGGLASTSSGALFDWLQGFLSKPDVDLILDPAQHLAEHFTKDLKKSAAGRRVVLILDTYERINTLNNWVCNLARHVNQNMLFILSGRTVPDWNRLWPGWVAQAYIKELEPMCAEVMRELVGRYQFALTGSQLDPSQADAIVRFARGIPLVATTAVELSNRYGVVDFQTVKPLVVADLVDRLMEGVPRSTRPVLEAAAVVHWFNKDILRILSRQQDVDSIYDEIRRFPFVRPRTEGLSIHEVVREIVDENLHVTEPDRHRELHEQAAAYFESQIAEDKALNTEQLGLELLYHRISADERSGMQFVQTEAEKLVQCWLVNRLRTLLKDLNSFPLLLESSLLWRRYYNAQLAAFERRFGDAETVLEAIAGDDQAGPKLRAYALCELGAILRKSEMIGRPGGQQKADEVIERSVQGVEIDANLTTAYTNLTKLYFRQGRWALADGLVHKLIDFFRRTSDQIGLVGALTLAKGNHGRIGRWKETLQSYEEALRILNGLPEHPVARVKLLSEAPWAMLWAGRYTETEEHIKECLDYLAETGDVGRLATLWGDYGYVAGLQCRFEEAEIRFREALRFGPSHPGTIGFLGATLLRQGRLEDAEMWLRQSLTIKEEKYNYHGIPELLNWLGEI